MFDGGTLRPVKFGPIIPYRGKIKLSTFRSNKVIFIFINVIIILSEMILKKSYVWVSEY